MSSTRHEARKVIKGKCKWAVLLGDSKKVLRKLKSNSVDSIVTDPPAGIEFMGAEWDSFAGNDLTEKGHQTSDTWGKDKGSKPTPFARQSTPRYRGKQNSSLDAFQDFMVKVFHEALRVLKPGGFALVWAIPRTSHHTAMALERAGFEIRDVVTHHFGQGFPKSLNIGKALDRKLGKKRKSTGIYHHRHGGGKGRSDKIRQLDPNAKKTEITRPASAESLAWEGWGTALKPGSEHWILCRKPTAFNYASNILEHGVGALNIDGCRIGTIDDVPSVEATRQKDYPKSHDGNGPGWGRSRGGKAGDKVSWKPKNGRWPANIILSHSDLCVPLGQARVKATSNGEGKEYVQKIQSRIFGQSRPGHKVTGYGGADGKENVEVWDCIPGCPVRLLDQQGTSQGSHSAGSAREDPGGGTYDGSTASSYKIGMNSKGYRFGDAGGVSRFYYIAKTSTRERHEGCRKLYWRQVKGQYVQISKSRYKKYQKKNAHRTKAGKRPKYVLAHGNFHPTVKSFGLMSYLCRLITPRHGVVLDPFTGSGTTGGAAMREGFRFIGVERDPAFHKVASSRIAYQRKEHRKKIKDPPGLKPLFNEST